MTVFPTDDSTDGCNCGLVQKQHLEKSRGSQVCQQIYKESLDCLNIMSFQCFFTVHTIIKGFKESRRISVHEGSCCKPKSEGGDI